MPRARQTAAARYSAAELFGRSIDSLSMEELHTFAVAGQQQICPFRSQAAGVELLCNKKGGVCSIRPFERQMDGTAIVGGAPAITCPNRFLEQREVFRWVGDVILRTDSPTRVPELPFLMGADADDSDPDAVGMIDMVLVNSESTPLAWCALEMQAVYFSGGSMGNDQRQWQNWTGPNLPYPSVQRRPDFRSSGPKRLMPQLQVKVPTIRRWGKKMAVVVDSEFWASLRTMREVPNLSNSDIVWFVVRLERCGTTSNLKLVRDSVHYTRLEDAVEGLTGGTPLPLETFERLLLEKLARLEAR
ncbi:MAG: NotI family restriction endonuclease [Candidatus Sumerlaeaceae bacterium]